MASAHFLRVLICMQILSFACAAPPISPVASNSITLISPSENTTDLRFAAYVDLGQRMKLTDAESRFPHPLPDPFTYHVRADHYEYDIIFSRTSVYRGLNETQIGICMRKAILMARNVVSGDPSFPFSKIPIKIYAGHRPGDVEFQIHNQLPYHPMTWGNWADVLVGFDGFTKAYPGRGFIFQVQDSSGMPLYGAMHGAMN